MSFEVDITAIKRMIEAGVMPDADDENLISMKGRTGIFLKHDLTPNDKQERPTVQTQTPMSEQQDGQQGSTPNTQDVNWKSGGSISGVDMDNKEIDPKHIEEAEKPKKIFKPATPEQMQGRPGQISKITDEELNKRVVESPDICPFCRNEEVDEVDHRREINEIDFEMQCSACLSMWIIEYTPTQGVRY